MPENTDQMKQVLKEADCLYTEKEVIDAIDEMAFKISSTLADKNPLVICIMNGGLFFTAYLTAKLHFPLQMDYCHATRYRGEVTGKDLHFRASPSQKMEGRTVLLVDDILDEGYTLSALVKRFKAQKAESVQTAVLVDKKHDRKASKGLKADFTGLTIPDRYVFGFGMDYKEYWRNLSNIYAVKGL